MYKVFLNGPYGSPPSLVGSNHHLNRRSVSFVTVSCVLRPSYTLGGAGVAHTLPCLLDILRSVFPSPS